jgi:hypothetical protein
MLHGHPNMAETVTIIGIPRSLRGPLVLFNPALGGLRVDASVCYHGAFVEEGRYLDFKRFRHDLPPEPWIAMGVRYLSARQLTELLTFERGLE